MPQITRRSRGSGPNVNARQVLTSTGARCSGAPGTPCIAFTQGGLSHMLDILVIVIVVLTFSAPSAINEFMDGDA